MIAAGKGEAASSEAKTGMPMGQVSPVQARPVAMPQLNRPLPGNPQPQTFAQGLAQGGQVTQQFDPRMAAQMMQRPMV